jgi:thiol-disulfide isomerase/thioredoxin
MPESNLDFITILMLLIVIIIFILIILNINKVNDNKINAPCNQMENIASIGQNEQIEPVVSGINSDNNAKNETQLALYYTNWCGYSRQFFPEWEKIQNSDLKNKISFISYDCDKSKQCSIDNVNGFPSLILHKNGKQIKFPDNLERNATNVINFVTNY